MRFARDSCKGTLGEEKVQPQFSVEEANIFYPGRYSSPTNLDINKLDWMVPPPPPPVPFNLSAIRPSHVKNILKSKAPNKAPGEDGLLYGVLLRLPSIHHILATLFTRTNESNLAPASGRRAQWSWHTKEVTRKIPISLGCSDLLHWEDLPPDKGGQTVEIHE